MTRIILLATAIFLLNSGNTTSATTNAEKANPGDESQAIDREIERKTYDRTLFPAVKDGKYGFIDLTGSFVIPPIFTAAENFSEGMAAVYVGGRSFIDSSADLGTNKTVQFINQENGKWGYIDRTGEIKIPPQFGYAKQFSEGLALVTLGEGMKGRAGYIDAHGLFKITPKFAALFSSPFKHGIAAVRSAKIEEIRAVEGRFFDGSGNEISVSEAVGKQHEQNKEYWIDTSGNEIDSIKALGIVRVNRIAFKQKKNIQLYGRAFEVEQYGLKDDKGNIVVNAMFDSIGDFYSPRNGKAYGLTEACKASTWETYGDFAILATKRCGLIDIHGSLIAPQDFDQIVLMSEELARFEIGCVSLRLGGCASAKNGIYSIKALRPGEWVKTA